MGSFGERLQREREMRGITLDEIAEATKIGTRSLRALEEEDFDKLPGGIFNKGFVRAYSRYLGIDEEQAVTDYIAAVAEAQAGGRLSRLETEVAARPDKDHDLDDISDERPRVPPMAWGALAAVVVLAAAGFAGARYVSSHGWPQLRRAQAASSKPPAMTAVAATPVAPPASTAPQTPAPATPAASGPATSAPAASAPAAAVSAASPEDGFLLRVRAKREAWILLVVDGKQEMSGVLAADAEKAVRAQKRVVFKTGNAAAIELFQNGQPLPLLGEDKQVKQVTITAQGMQESSTKKTE